MLLVNHTPLMKVILFLSFICLLVSCRHSSSSSTRSIHATRIAPTIGAREQKKQKRITKLAVTSADKNCIIIDPGHGGKDGGARSIIKPHIQEKVLTLKTAIKVREFLVNWGHNVYLTRKSDVFIPLQGRVAFAQRQECQLFVSIHYNSTPKPTKAKGVEIYYFKGQKGSDQKALTILERETQSQKLASYILKRITSVTQTPNRGVRAGNFCVIRETTMPAVLVECGFLSNAEEARKLRNPGYIRFLAWSIAKGIDDFVRKK